MENENRQVNKWVDHSDEHHWNGSDIASELFIDSSNENVFAWFQRLKQKYLDLDKSNQHFFCFHLCVITDYPGWISSNVGHLNSLFIHTSIQMFNFSTKSIVWRIESFLQIQWNNAVLLRPYRFVYERNISISFSTVQPKTTAFIFLFRCLTFISKFQIIKCKAN